MKWKIIAKTKVLEKKKLLKEEEKSEEMGR